MPILTTRKAEDMCTFTLDWPTFLVLYFNNIIAVWGWTPSQKPVALQNKQEINDKPASKSWHDSILKLLIWCTSTKLLVMRCWYLRRTLESFTSLMTVTSSTKISQPCAAQAIVCPTPSSIILVVRYPPQHWVQKRWPHSNPVIN